MNNSSVIRISRLVIKSFALIALITLPFSSSWIQAQEAASKKPNFLWILSEDNSKHFLKLFDETGAETPNIARLAQDGIQFNNAYSCSPVCSVARTTLMTSVYAPRLGTQYHRKIEQITQPGGWEIFTAFLKKSGYYTTNNSKKDYNVVEKGEAWNESSRSAHWRNRDSKDMPFFHMQSYSTSHESSLHFSRQVMENTKTSTDPETVFIPPVHPSTPTFKYTYARYHDRIMEIDKQVGALVAQLEEDGVLEDTFIFYFGDHGGVLPGSKGYINERGTHVPLVVRIPENFKHLTPLKRNASVNGFVSFVDFGPTVLHLAGLDVPDYSDGRPFLGPRVNQRRLNRNRTAFTHADRFDEKYDTVRAIRVGDWKYVRNFQSYYPDGLQNNYRYKMLAYEEWRTLFNQGKLNKVQAQFFQPKPIEMLFNLADDPYETKNLASHDEHGTKLRQMRRSLRNFMASIHDLSLFPENIIVENAANSINFGAQKAFQLKKLYTITDLATRPYEDAENPLKSYLQSNDPTSRYWAVSVSSEFGKKAAALAPAISNLKSDPDPLVRLKAAEFLALVKNQDPVPVIQDILKTNSSPTVSLIVLNSVVYLKDHLGFSGWNISPQSIKAINPEVQRRILYLQSPNN